MGIDTDPQAAFFERTKGEAVLVKTIQDIRRLIAVHHWNDYVIIDTSPYYDGDAGAVNNDISQEFEKFVMPFEPKMGCKRTQFKHIKSLKGKKLIFVPMMMKRTILAKQIVDAYSGVSEYEDHVITNTVADKLAFNVSELNGESVLSHCDGSTRAEISDVLETICGQI